MITNLLEAFYNIVHTDNMELVDVYKGINRAHNMGAALEVFIKDAFCGTIGQKDKNNVLKQYSEKLSYLGNANNPPDFIIKNSDAVEVKKINGISNTIQLNSSPPKNKLYANNKRITKACLTCEDDIGGWQKKILYMPLVLLKII